MSFKELEWKSEYSIGIDELDEQHKILLGIMNTFLKAEYEGKENEVLKETLTELINYTNFHFSAEEEHMEKNSYFRLEGHKQQHQGIVNDIVNILNLIKEGKPQANEELHGLLKKWLITHIMQQDKQYGIFYFKKHNPQ